MGMDTIMPANIYVTCIRSMLLYSCQVFHFNLPEFLNIMLERIQKRAMNIIYGYDVPYSEALVMSKLHKLSDHRSYLCDDFFKKILLNPNDKLHGLLPYNISVISSLRKKRDFLSSCTNFCYSSSTTTSWSRDRKNQHFWRTFILVFWKNIQCPWYDINNVIDG